VARCGEPIRGLQRLLDALRPEAGSPKPVAFVPYSESPVPEPSSTRRMSNSLVHRSASMPRTKCAVVPDPSSQRGMPSATCGRKPRIAGRQVMDCFRGPAVAGRPSHGYRHDPASAGPSTHGFRCHLCIRDSHIPRLAPPCDARTAVARLYAPSRCARSPGARLHPASCARSRAGSPPAANFLSSRGSRPPYWPDRCGSSTRVRGGCREPERRDRWTFECQRLRRRHMREVRLAEPAGLMPVGEGEKDLLARPFRSPPDLHAPGRIPISQ
jgi:hypothetical protein